MKEEYGTKKGSWFSDRPILAKFFLIFVSTFVIVSVISGIIIYNIIGDYIAHSKKDEILSSIDGLNELWSQYYTTYKKAAGSPDEWVSDELKLEYETALANLMSGIEMYESFFGDGSFIFICESNGQISFSYPLLPNSGRYAAGRKILPNSVASSLTEIGNTYWFNKKGQFTSVVLSDKEYIEDTGDFYGLYSAMNVPYYTISGKIPYVFPETGDSITAGVISVSVPLPSVNKARNVFVGFFSLMTVLGVLIEFVVLFLFTKKITDPLRSLKEGAERVATGDFTKKIAKNSNDEIGVLVDCFNQMQDSLANLDSMRNDFIANVSHELRTPMTSIGGFIDAISEGIIPPEKQPHYLGIIRNEITRLTQLVNELLDIAKLQSGRTKLNYTHMDVNALAALSLAKLEPIISEKGIECDVNFENEEEYVWIDENAVSRVFINLIQNAVKFTQTGGTITVHTRRLDKFAEVTVQDTGAGIAPEDLEMIFERFYKADKSRGLDKKGTGLGLSLCKNILKAHGGSIRVESVLGEGSSFIFTLPIECPETDSLEGENNNG